MVCHSSLVHNASSRSLGYLNQVSIDFSFLFKTYLEQWPTRCLLLFSAVIFCIGSWSLRACNYGATEKQISMLDSMWLFIVTYTTVGSFTGNRIYLKKVHHNIEFCRIWRRDTIELLQQK